MEKNQAKSFVKEVLQQQFDQEKFELLVKNLLNDYEVRDNNYSGNLIPEAFRDHIANYKRIGKYIDPDGIELDILIVHTKTVSKLERTRTALRNFVVRHLKSFDKNYALVAFYSKEDHGEDWRLSFVKIDVEQFRDDKGKIKTKDDIVPAKRFSFLVGENEDAYTAQKQLLPILTNVVTDPLIEKEDDGDGSIEGAFSIEKVTDEFYEQYKELYLKLIENQVLTSALQKEEMDIPRFVKKLLGQIVFLYFLQKKGWLGVPKNEKMGEGSKRFLQNQFDQYSTNDNYFKSFLRYLFYEALAREHNDQDIKYYFERLDCKIPFLNGGLFEAEYDWENSPISIPNELFRNEEKNKAGDKGTGILDVFDRYNFTIKEDEPLEKEVAVDPEMLGKVFENMLEITERKSKGAFYTPREVVHYMCQESLIHYLDNSINDYSKTYQPIDSDQLSLVGGSMNKRGTGIIEFEHSDIKVPREDLELFIRNGHLVLENEMVTQTKGKETKSYKFKLPETIRTNASDLDSKLANIKICDPAIGSGAFPVGLLHEIVIARQVLNSFIQNDSHTPYYLKRHAIQESLYGVDIDASAIDIARLRLWLSMIVDEEDYENIEALPNLDYKIVNGNSLIGLPEDYEPRWLDELEEEKKEFFECTDEEKKKVLRVSINSKLFNYLKSTERTLGYQVDFDYKLFFSEVWHEKNGFDLVIGNPPYFQIQKLARSKEQVNLQKQRYQSFSKTGDLYQLFYEKGYRILRPSGILTFITSNKWMRAAYGKSTRFFLSQRTNPLLVIDFGNVQNFTSATVDTNILQFEKAENQHHTVGIRIDNDFHPTTHSILDYISDRVAHFQFTSFDEWVITKPEMLRIKKTVESQGLPLSEWKVEINYGLKTGLNKAFIIDEETKKQILEHDPGSISQLKPLLRGKDIQRWRPAFNDLWLVYIPWHFPLHEDQTIKGCSKDAEENFVSSYPGLHRHLKRYYDDLSNRNQVEVNIRYEWYALQRFGSHYWRDFEKPKIVYPNMTKYMPFVYDRNDNYYSNDKSFIMVGEDLEYLCCFLNSELFRGVYQDNFPELQGGTRELRKVFVEKIPVKKIDRNELKVFEVLINYLLMCAELEKGSLIDTFFNALNDAVIYNLYFTEEFKRSKKEILSQLYDIQPIQHEMSNEEKLRIIKSEFNRLYDPNHSVRNNLETLDSIEEVRIIKEALK